ncbi:tetratricopeptide repeat protein : Tetratricopeptide repeat protein OS=Singulisphaera acidiphila (strain ATCC BAA-1392 / DSM 18658 / VKM B-2454 / MOB10) GN=Sinac_5500 PE=4 SV=1: TPR_14: TPR_2: TPR_2: TPR_2 [Gemmataceae bacterium]|nr:tetratricopeptide repeat protein : Tetratricopeptide repeat protein OS=Singulisphaera acidiphila (strain ATCC BAA-1392 / DSM 18658 / VKM B-2454 / MOB10) GN=Sinac_5500 PE=4 SV=1: TPR_14: TPR_2: TPR_2: TPR_2 [Gemmataceae bacterium]VTU01317.1 tetratricopeptide repeat protein : Tetratricopeptide repeat protein OS=Singulisphaera acidiphila (strain ATCC BAA-1392 / DSM 18658 / VKM B-2454 / MOB10) GN=Sinac_5500 PE=4 SV=1: TPR_14: TPR_2: TPR_2: TPR_2 [Gemmataceae bacterium]
MVTGLLVALALAAPPADPPPPRLPTAGDAHKDAVTTFGLAVWNARRERLLTSAAQLEAAAKSDPDATAPLRELVRTYTQLGREPEAIRVARQVLARDPRDVDVAHALAKLLFDAGDPKGAVAAAKLATEGPLPAGRADKAVAIYRDLATLCEKADDPAGAEAALRRAVEWLTDRRKEVIAAGGFSPRGADTAAAECLERLGKVRTRLRKFDEAAEAFAAAAKLYADPLKGNDSASAALLAWHLSGVLQAKGETDGALRHLEQFLKLRPVSPDPYARLAALLRDAGRDADVAPALRRLLDADPKNRPLEAVLAAELARRHQTRGEADARFKSLMAATNDPKVVEVVVRSHLELNRPREIVSELDRAFAVLKDKDKTDKPVDPVELAAAREFAAGKARAVAAVVRDDRAAVVALLGAAAADAETGTKRTHGVHYFLGQLAARQRELELAAFHFQTAVRNANRETVGDAYGALLTVLNAARKPADVARVCREALQAIENPPHLPLAPHYFNYYLSGALADLGEEEKALAAADLCIQQTADGDRLTVRVHKVHVLCSLGKWDAGIDLGKKLLDEFPAKADRASVRYALAGAYWGAKKADEAEAELRAILDADPDHAAAANDLGFHLADQSRDLPEAERLVRHAIATDRLARRKAGDAEPESAAYLDSLGWVLFRRGQLAEARAELERAAALPSGAVDPVVWDHLGDVQFRLGEKAKAKAAWERSAELSEAENRAGVRARRDGRLDEVRRKLKRVP